MAVNLISGFDVKPFGDCSEIGVERLDFNDKSGQTGHTLCRPGSSNLLRDPEECQ